MSNASIRHRTAAKQGSENIPALDTVIRNPRNSSIQRQHTKLHAGVWGRMIAIVVFFILLSQLILRIGRSNDASKVEIRGGSIRSGGAISSGGSANGHPLFVTVVMPRYVMSLLHCAV